jgi:hypothetical protein
VKYLNYGRHWQGAHDLGRYCSDGRYARGKPALLRHTAWLALGTSVRCALDEVRINRRMVRWCGTYEYRRSLTVVVWMLVVAVVGVDERYRRARAELMQSVPTDAQANKLYIIRTL